VGSTTMNRGKFAPPQARLPEPHVTPVVYIVDDDVSVRESLELLIRCAGWQAIALACARDFLSHPPVFAPSCLILDVDLPDINGLDLQQQLAHGHHPPIIFLTGHGDIPTSVRAIKAGALDFLTKPYRVEKLRDLVGAALALDCERRTKQSELDGLQQRRESLTPREREVLPLVVSGHLNKQAAAHLGISEITYQIHRTNVMRKMEAGSLAELVRMADALEIPVSGVRRIQRPSARLGFATGELGFAYAPRALTTAPAMSSSTLKTLGKKHDAE
jgi:FixJ family two-component response regulator